MKNKKNHNISDYTVVIPGVENEKPLFKGTRLPVSFILDQIKLGWNINQIKQRYPEIKKSYLVNILEILSYQIDTPNDGKKETYNSRYSHDGCQSAAAL
jgi:uncharacterized protein (DUF433 family)